MNKIYLTFVPITLALSAMAGAAELQIEREIHLNEHAYVYSKKVCLADLVSDAWIKGKCQSEKNHCCYWDLGSELHKTLSREEIQQKLFGIKFGGVTPDLRGAPAVTINQTHRALTSNDVLRRLEGALLDRFPGKANDITVSSIQFQQPIYVALHEESDWRIALPEALQERSLFQIISTKESGKILGWITAHVFVARSAFVSKKTIHPNDLLKSEDFDRRSVNAVGSQWAGASLVETDVFPDGVQARQTILIGMPLTVGGIERTPSVNLGDSVTLILRSESLKVSTKGVAQGKAAVGDMVTVQLSKYNRSFRGKLLNGKCVEVWL